MRTIAPLRNCIQCYDWGSRSAIAELLGNPVPSAEPQAELWMGAHPVGPSLARSNGSWKALPDLIERHPVAILGEPVARKFLNRLPFLFKILAAAEPMSMQVHPNRQQAAAGFARENALGIPLNAFDRSYKDSNHKPEILYALTEFDALNGFRPIDEIIEIMGELQHPAVAGPLIKLRANPDREGLKRFFRAVMTMGTAETRETTAQAIRVVNKQGPEPASEWVIRINQLYPGDVGVLCAMMMRFIRLQPGQGLFQGPGTLHACLQGIAIELMANSDNVHRAGLTRKHIDVPQLLKTLEFGSERAQVVEPKRTGEHETVWDTTAEEFVLSRVELRGRDRYTSAARRSFEILMCTEGEGHIVDSAALRDLELAKGCAVAVPAEVPAYGLEGDLTVFKAAVPGA